mgnify:CR=1 FL=1
MTTYKNKQSIHLWDKNDSSDQYPTLALILACSLCQTAKMFKVTAAAGDVIAKKLKGIDTETECEKCGTRFGVTLAWRQDKLDPTHAEKSRQLRAVIEQAAKEIMSGEEFVIRYRDGEFTIEEPRYGWT